MNLSNNFFFLYLLFTLFNASVYHTYGESPPPHEDEIEWEKCVRSYISNSFICMQKFDNEVFQSDEGQNSQDQDNNQNLFISPSSYSDQEQDLENEINFLRESLKDKEKKIQSMGKNLGLFRYQLKELKKKVESTSTRAEGINLFIMTNNTGNVTSIAQEVLGQLLEDIKEKVEEARKETTGKVRF